MKKEIPGSLLNRLSGFVAEKMGLHFPADRWTDLQRGIVSATPDFCHQDTEKCIEWLLNTRLTEKQTEILASHLTVGETHFFRDTKAFEALENSVFPDLLRSGRAAGNRLKIWSAGCATGEEPYSLAILLHRLIPDINDWQITIFATDINPGFLKKASSGAYSGWSFRNTPGWVIDGYFKKREDGHYLLCRSIREMVSFSYFNLAEESYNRLIGGTGCFDLIVCRNVFIYFTEHFRQRVVDNFYHSLGDGGWLVVSPTEASPVIASRFRVINFPGAIFYRKDGSSYAQDQTAADKIVFPETYPLFDPLPDLTSLRDELPEETKELFPLSGKGRRAGARRNDEPAHGPAGKISIIGSAKDCANRGDLEEALKLCHKSLECDKLDPACHFLLATILQEQGRIDEAVTALQKALYLNRAFVLAHYSLGNLKRIMGRKDEAEKHFENALAVLNTYKKEDELPESDGMTAGRLREIIQSAVGSKKIT